MRVEGVIRMARLRRESGHRSAQAAPRPQDDRSDGQRYRGEDLPGDPPAQGRGHVAHGVHKENSLS